MIVSKFTVMNPNKEKTATVAEMIQRFRTAPPTCRAIREAMRNNGDGPIRMWYENNNKDTTLDQRNDEIFKAKKGKKIEKEIAQKEASKNIKDEYDSKHKTWRCRFRNGL